MVLVLTNDDGINAPGIRALWDAVGQEGIVVAPADHQSGCGHQVTTTRSISVEQRAEREFAIGGTPADCVRIALSHLVPTVDFVLSGINEGGNLGVDVYISGTVAAVREAAFHRIPAIAVSHYKQRGRSIDWNRATRMTVAVLNKLRSLPLEPGSFWNVNLPHPTADDPNPAIVFCPPCTQPLPVDYVMEAEGLRYVGKYPDRPRDPGADVEQCFAGHITVTQLRV